MLDKSEEALGIGFPHCMWQEGILSPAKARQIITRGSTSGQSIDVMPAFMLLNRLGSM